MVKCRTKNTKIQIIERKLSNAQNTESKISNRQNIESSGAATSSFGKGQSSGREPPDITDPWFSLNLTLTRGAARNDVALIAGDCNWWYLPLVMGVQSRLHPRQEVSEFEPLYFWEGEIYTSPILKNCYYLYHVLRVNSRAKRLNWEGPYKVFEAWRWTGSFNYGPRKGQARHIRAHASTAESMQHLNLWYILWYFCRCYFVSNKCYRYFIKKWK